MTQIRTPLLAIALGLAAIGAGCGGSQATLAPTAVSPVTERWSSSLAPRGATSRSVPVSTSGAISVTLVNIALPPTTPIGLGIGLQRGSANCDLSASVNATAGTDPQITIPVDPGTYCVSVYDTGTLTELVGFVLSITHP